MLTQNSIEMKNYEHTLFFINKFLRLVGASKSAVSIHIGSINLALQIQHIHNNVIGSQILMFFSHFFSLHFCLHIQIGELYNVNQINKN